MAFALDKLGPWGRSFHEYCRMFDLSDADLQERLRRRTGGGLVRLPGATRWTPTSNIWIIVAAQDIVTSP